MGFLAFLAIFLFCGWMLYSFYQSKVEQKPEDKKKEKAKELSSDFGGIENILSDYIDFANRKGFNITSIGDRRIELKKESNKSVAYLAFEIPDTDNIIFETKVRHIEGNYIEYEEQYERSNRPSTIRRFFENVIKEKIDSQKGSREYNKSTMDEALENIYSREEIFSEMWDNILSPKDTPGWAKEITNKFFKESCIYPPRFFENANYLMVAGQGEAPYLEKEKKPIKKHTSESVEYIIVKSKMHDHIKFPYWFMAAYPDVVNMAIDDSEAVHYDDQDNFSDHINPSTETKIEHPDDLKLKTETGETYNLEQCSKILNRYKSSGYSEASKIFEYNKYNQPPLSLPTNWSFKDAMLL